MKEILAKILEKVPALKCSSCGMHTMEASLPKEIVDLAKKNNGRYVCEACIEASLEYYTHTTEKGE